MNEGGQQCGEQLLDEPEYPESWQCCDSGCGEFCVYEIYRKDKQAFDEQQRRLALTIKGKNQ